MNTRSIIYSIDTRYPEGFIQEEINQLFSTYPELDQNKFKEALNNITCMVMDGEPVFYKHDVLIAFNCGIQSREKNDWEWD